MKKVYGIHSRLLLTLHTNCGSFECCENTTEVSWIFLFRCQSQEICRSYLQYVHLIIYRNAWIEMLHIWKNNNTGVVKQSNLDCPNIADSLECSIFAYLSLLSPFFLCFQQTRVFWEEEEVSKHLLVCLFFIISLPVPTVLKQLKLHSSDLTRRICILLRHHRILECVFRSECPC